MEQAIKKAIEGGYPRGRIGSASFFCMDKDFWQALGKAEGWGIVQPRGAGIEFISDEYWKQHWHRFIDHLAEGNSIDSFFNELLSI